MAGTVCFATFRLWGEYIQPHAITAGTGITPSTAYLPGELHDRTGRARPHGMWQISSEGRVTSDDLETHIAWVLDQLEPVKSFIDKHLGQSGTCADIYCYWEQDVNGGFSLSPTLVARIAALRVELGVEIA